MGRAGPRPGPAREGGPRSEWFGRRSPPRRARPPSGRKAADNVPRRPPSWPRSAGRVGYCRSAGLGNAIPSLGGSAGQVSRSCAAGVAWAGPAAREAGRPHQSKPTYWSSVRGRFRRGAPGAEERKRGGSREPRRGSASPRGTGPAPPPGAATIGRGATAFVPGAAAIAGGRRWPSSSNSTAPDSGQGRPVRRAGGRPTSSRPAPAGARRREPRGWARRRGKAGGEGRRPEAFGPTPVAAAQASFAQGQAQRDQSRRPRGVPAENRDSGVGLGRLDEKGALSIRRGRRGGMGGRPVRRLVEERPRGCTRRSPGRPPCASPRPARGPM